MKKTIVATALFAALIIIAGAIAGGNGAIKVDLVVRLGNGEVGDVVGFVVINTNGNGEVIAQVHMDDGDPAESDPDDPPGEFDVQLMARVSSNPDTLDSAIMTLNNKENANAHLKGPLGDNTQIKIRIGNAPMGQGNPNEIYLTRSADPADNGWLPVP